MKKRIDGGAGGSNAPRPKQTSADKGGAKDMRAIRFVNLFIKSFIQN